MDITHHFIQVQGIRTHYMEAGQGSDIVVLLHGGGLDCAQLSWELLMAELAAVDGGARFRVIAPDWPGFGETAPLPGGATLTSFGPFLTDFLDQLGIQNASFAGISMGGGAVLGFALQSPERVEKLILVDSYGLQRAAPLHRLSYLFIRLPGVRQLTWAAMRSRAMARYSLKMLLKRPGSVTDELVNQVYEQLMRPGASRAFSEFQDSEITWNGIRTCYVDRLNEITAPTLIIHGSLDALVPLSCAREAHEKIHNSRLHWMEGSGHWPQRDNPEEFNQLVIEFLK
jgi:pimeloyl-ACP methyl ester carboxylesterase